LGETCVLYLYFCCARHGRDGCASLCKLFIFFYNCKLIIISSCINFISIVNSC
jgi:hypothetical protein